MKHILVTGCNGQLGNEIQAIASKSDEESQFFFTDVNELDITDRKAVYNYIEQNHISIVVNCAAFTAVDKAENEAELCDLLNHIAPGYLAEAVASVGGTMIQVSTDYVFDGTSCIPYKEEDSTNPQTVYGRTKLAGEESVIRSCPGSMVIRTAWLYSTYGNNFVKTMIRLGKERDTIGVIFDQIGTPTYAHDLARAIMTVIDKGIVPGVYHFTNEGVCSWFDFTRAIHQYKGIDNCTVSPIHTEDYPTPAQRPHYSVLDKTKFKNTYNFAIRWWEDALKECIKEL